MKTCSRGSGFGCLVWRRTATITPPARLAELLSIELRLERLGRTSYTFGYDAFRLPERTHLADGYVTIAIVARDTFRPTPVPQELATRLKTLVLPKPRRAPSTRKK